MVIFQNITIFIVFFIKYASLRDFNIFFFFFLQILHPQLFNGSEYMKRRRRKKNFL